MIVGGRFEYVQLRSGGHVQSSLPLLSLKEKTSFMNLSLGGL